METTGQKLHHGRCFIVPNWMRIRLRTLVALVAVAALVMAVVIDLDNRKHRDQHGQSEAKLRKYISGLETYFAAMPPSAVDADEIERKLFAAVQKALIAILRKVRQKADEEAALKAQFQRRLILPN